MTADLQRQIDELRAELATLRRRRFQHSRRRRLPLLVAALLVALVPLATLAANPFGDLNPGSVHNGNIDAIYNAGITTGCDPNAAYCPNGLVTREEMASFLARAAGLGGNPPVANALTAQTAATAQTVPDGAITAAKLGPQGSTAGQVLTSTGADVVWRNPSAAQPTVGGSAGRVARAPEGTRAIAYPVANNFNPGAPDDPAHYLLAMAVELVAPTPGYVLVTGVVGAQRDSGTGDLGMVARLRSAADTTGADGSPREFGYPARDAAGLQTVAVTWVFPVAAGPQRFLLEVARFSPQGGTGQISLINPALTALFVPFDGNGNAP